MVEDHFDALLADHGAGLGDEIRTRVVDGVRGSQLQGLVELGVAAGGHDDVPSAQQLGDLYASARHAGAGGVDQHVLSRAQRGAGVEHVPGSEKDQRQRSGLGEGEPRRQRQDVSRRYDDELGVAAVAVLAEDAVVAAEHVLVGAAALAVAARDSRSQ